MRSTTNTPRRVLSLVVLALLTTTCLLAQVFDPQPPDATPLFDPTQNVVFFGYGVVHPGAPALRAYTDGKQRGGAIDLFKDFPDVHYAVVNGFAAGPPSNSVLATVLGYGKNVVRHVLLFYGDRGQLLKIWDTDPYYTYALAVDADGDVYTLAIRTDLNDNKDADYPLLIRYQPDGRVAHKSLPKSIFRGSTAQAITSVGGTILPVLRIKGDRIFVFAPLTLEVVAGTKNGETWERHQLSGIRIQGATKSEIKRVDFAGNGDVLVEVRGAKEGRRITELQRVNPKTGERCTIKRQDGNNPDVFMGVLDDRYIEFANDRSGKKAFAVTVLPSDAQKQQ